MLGNNVYFVLFTIISVFEKLIDAFSFLVQRTDIIPAPTNDSSITVRFL